MIVWFSEKKHLLMMRLVVKMNNLGRVPVSEVIARQGKCQAVAGGVESG